MKDQILKVRTSNTLKGSLVKKIQNVRFIITHKWKARKQILERARGKSESRDYILHAWKRIKNPCLYHFMPSKSKLDLFIWVFPMTNH